MKKHLHIEELMLFYMQFIRQALSLSSCGVLMTHSCQTLTLLSSENLLPTPAI